MKLLYRTYTDIGGMPPGPPPIVLFGGGPRIAYC